MAEGNMVVKDGNGAFIDFEWPSLWYLFKAGFAVTFGVATGVVVLWWPLVILWHVFLSQYLTLVLRALESMASR